MSRRTERALNDTIIRLSERLAQQDTIIKVLSEQNQRLVAAALVPVNPVGAAIVRVRPASADEPKAPVQHAVGL